MCIRDRHYLVLVQNNHELRATGGFIAAIGKITLDQGKLVAVSYTHLRAHETVLDIVCRLLLEKKTYKETNLSINILLTDTKYDSDQQAES
mgnify:CR=1 FL=1